MKVDSTDWRLQGQERYLKNQTLQFKKYNQRISATDHDHCEFCGVKFSDDIQNALKEGYSTLDDYRWICPTCFDDFEEMFNFQLLDYKKI